MPARKARASRADQELPPSALLITSPYDVEARYSRKKSTIWTGYKVHCTQTCETDEPHFMVEVTTTAATTPDGELMGELHEQLAEHELLPDQHLVDRGYVDADVLAHSQCRYQVEVVGPVPPDVSWQAQQVTCPTSQARKTRGIIPDRHGKLVVQSRMKQAGMRWEASHVNPMLAMGNLACNVRWMEGWRAIRQTWHKNEMARRVQRAVHPSSSGEQAVSLLPTALPHLEAPASSEPSLPVLSSTKQPSDAPPEPRPLRPVPTHPWRRPFIRRRSA